MAMASFFRPVTDPDFWWQVRTGEWIAAHRSLPSHDLYTYTVSGHPWHDYEALPEVIMWWLFDHGGLVAISVAYGLLLCAGLAVLIQLARMTRPHYVALSVAVVAGVLAGAPVWGPRVQAVSFVLTCVTLLLLHRHLDGRRRALLWLPPLAALWANLHPGWLALLGLVGLAMAATAPALLVPGTRRPALVRLRDLALAGAASAAAVLLNPLGAEEYPASIAPLISPAQHRLIEEWQPPNLADPHLWPLVAFIALVLLGIAIGRVGAFRGLTALATIALALISARDIPLLVAAGVPVVAMGLTRVIGLLAARVRWRERPLPAARGAALSAVVLIAVAGIAVTAVSRQLGAERASVRALFPVAAADWLAAHPSDGTRMFNAYDWGGYLAYRFYPRRNRRVYIFSEATVMGDASLWRYEDIVSMRPGWREDLDRTGIDYAVLPRTSRLAGALARTPGWRLVHHDRLAVILARTGVSR
ncbi:MAG TPA: hypothetical protein VIA06_07965 [Candidatus Dormibacteraeota bacterium]|jgi:hypothetical protein|nr:hypothetical protein [Candidatus Dormibacteraeota bacterium]